MTRDRRCLRLKSRGIVFARGMRQGLIDSLKFPVAGCDYRYVWIKKKKKKTWIQVKRCKGFKAGEMRPAIHGLERKHNRWGSCVCVCEHINIYTCVHECVCVYLCVR